MKYGFGLFRRLWFSEEINRNIYDFIGVRVMGEIERVIKELFFC